MAGGGSFTVVNTGVRMEVAQAKFTETGQRGFLFATIPSAWELYRLRKRALQGEMSLPHAYRMAAEHIASLPDERHSFESILWRARIAQLEARSLPKLPAGNRSVAILALEAVANAISCWTLSLNGRPLNSHTGTVYCSAGGFGTRGEVFMPCEQSRRPPDSVMIDIPHAVLTVPHWFFETHDLPLPLDRESVTKCKRAAGKALRELLWMMYGWNTGHIKFGDLECHQEIGNREIWGSLSSNPDEVRREDDPMKTESVGGEIERLHKAMAKEFDRIERIPLERLPVRVIGD